VSTNPEWIIPRLRLEEDDHWVGDKEEHMGGGGGKVERDERTERFDEGEVRGDDRGEERFEWEPEECFEEEPEERFDDEPEERDDVVPKEHDKDEQGGARDEDASEVGSAMKARYRANGSYP
jgi:hypothetical protein